MHTKRELIAEALSELGLGDDFDIQPEETQAALRRLDAMMATWDAKGIQLGYALPANPADSDPDQASGLPDTAVETVCLHLAMRIAPSFGKVVSIDTRRNAADGYARLQVAAAQPLPAQQRSTMPQGAGNKPWRYPSAPFFPTPTTDVMRTTPGGDLNILES